MKSEALEQYGISQLRLLCLGAAVSSVVAAGVWAVAGGVLGQAGPEAILVVATLVFYIVVSTPRRLRDKERIAQARESVLLVASARACLGATGSRSRALAALRPKEKSIAVAVSDAMRSVLLGIRVEVALREASRTLSSYSAVSAMRSIAVLRSTSFEAEDEETKGLASSGSLMKETKLPMFMTVCFFAPIMMLFYAVFSHAYGAASLSELAALEFVAIDLALYFSAPSGGSQ